MRSDRERFPDDLRFQETADRTGFQGRYVLRHPWRANRTCRTGEDQRTLPGRFEREAETLAALTGWRIGDIRRRMGFDGPAQLSAADPWWRRIWRRD